MPHLFIHSLIEVFPLLAIMKNTAINIHAQIFVWTLVWILLNMYLRVDCQGHMVTVYLASWRITKLFHKVDVTFCIRTSNAGGFQFLYLLNSICDCTLAVLVSFDFYDKNTRYWMAWELFISHNSDGCKVQDQSLADSVLPRALFLVCRWSSPCSVLMCKREMVRSDQLLSRVRLFVTPWTSAHQTSMSITSLQFSSVTQSCWLCNPMNRSTPGLPVHHQLLDFTQTHVHRVSDAMQPSHPLLSPSPPAPNPSQHQSLFQWVNSSHEVAKVLEFQL